MRLRSLYWYAVILWSRLRCRLGGHQDTVRAGHGYLVTWCCRCYRHDLRVDCTACEGTSGGVHTCRVAR